MKLRTIASSVALVTALAFSGSALAQFTLDGAEVPGDRINEFHDKCIAVQASSLASLSETTPEPTEEQTAESVPETSDDPAAREHWDTALASLTLEDCEANNFFRQ